MTEKYFVVKLNAFAFESKAAAEDFADKLSDAFCEMPEAEDYGCTIGVYEETDD